MQKRIKYHRIERCECGALYRTYWEEPEMEWDGDEWWQPSTLFLRAAKLTAGTDEWCTVIWGECKKTQVPICGGKDTVTHFVPKEGSRHCYETPITEELGSEKKDDFIVDETIYYTPSKGKETS